MWGRWRCRSQEAGKFENVTELKKISLVSEILTIRFRGLRPR
jgi:hypothetical protein